MYHCKDADVDVLMLSLMTVADDTPVSGEPTNRNPQGSRLQPAPGTLAQQHVDHLVHV